MKEIRVNRIESIIGHEISQMLIQEKIKDPRVHSMLSITRVKVSNDFSHAKIYISSFDDSRSLGKGVEGLNHAAGWIQNQLAKALNTRQTPRIVFYFDDSIKDAILLNQKIDRIVHP